jgi:hypothetical protein
MSLFTPGKDLTQAGKALEDNGAADLSRVLLDLAAKAGPEGEALLAQGQAALSNLLAAGLQAVEVLIARGEQAGLNVIDHAAQYEIYVGFRLKPTVGDPK